MFNAISSSVSTASANTSNFFNFDHINHKIIGSEINFKRAGNPDSDQYKNLMKFMAMKPDFTLAPIPGKKKVEKKQTYAGLNMELIADFVRLFGTEDDKAMLAEMKETKTPYPTVKSWFLEGKKDFSVSKAQRDIAKKVLENNKANIRKAVAVKVKTAKATPAVIEMPAASNF